MLAGIASCRQASTETVRTFRASAEVDGKLPDRGGPFNLAIGMIAFHAFASHNIPRYTLPAVPMMVMEPWCPQSAGAAGRAFRKIVPVAPAAGRLGPKD